MFMKPCEKQPEANFFRSFPCRHWVFEYWSYMYLQTVMKKKKNTNVNILIRTALFFYYYAGFL